MRRLLSLSLIVFASNAFAADNESTKVTGTATVPKSVASFEKLTLEVRLYAYDPRIADKPADLVDKLEIKNFKHAMGTDTVEKIELGAKGKLDPNLGYYITTFVLDGKERAFIGDIQHAPDGFAKVLTGGQPREITATVRSLKK